MSQRQVIEFLKKKRKFKRYYSVKDISKAVGNNCSISCTKLRRFNLVDFREENIRIDGRRGRSYFIYRWKA